LVADTIADTIGEVGEVEDLKLSNLALNLSFLLFETVSHTRAVIPFYEG
jgi:hypothetical protein